jgi:acyl-coenzyme A thioesterase PaaI-like protein
VSDRSLQERFAPNGRCFGCGPANARGLRIESHRSSDGTVVATWTARQEHEAWDGVVNGGILGTLIDCHSNWTAIAALMARDGLNVAPSTVTAELTVRFRRPTPSTAPIHLVGRAVTLDGDQVTVETTVTSGDVLTATGRATFVRVGPDHPAYGRW